MNRHRAQRRATSPTRLGGGLAAVVIFAAALLGGCSSTDEAPPAAMEGPRLSARDAAEPKPGKALLHVIRGDDAAETMEVKLTAKVLGGIARDTYVTSEAEPGNYVLGCWLTYLDRDPVYKFTTVRLTADESHYYVASKVTRKGRPGDYGDTLAITIEKLPAADARQLVASLTRAGEKTAQATPLPFTREDETVTEPEVVAAAPELFEPEPFTEPPVDPPSDPIAVVEEPAPLELVAPEPVAPILPPIETSPADPPAFAELEVPPVIEPPIDTVETTELTLADPPVTEVESVPVETELETPVEAPPPAELAEVTTQPPVEEPVPTPEPVVKEVELPVEREVLPPVPDPEPVPLRDPVKLYKGPALARAEVSHLTVAEQVFVKSVNGMIHDVTSRGSKIAGVELQPNAFRLEGVELKPGWYRIEVEWHGPPGKERKFFGAHEVEIEMEAGRAYVVTARANPVAHFGWELATTERSNRLARD